ncbi:patatin-like phospholipase domain-containing protein 2 [Cocos nucifera]|uniref:Patatin n=1 Tax=Cocos nucifera TaxID=13894 RepID=A0A8K0I3H1_COCNU|nr:patatin-like phospholipase domain-containing protein 2 [Cocos nucifera]
MASLGSLPFLRPKPLSFSSPYPNPNHRFLPLRAKFRTRADGESSRKWPPRRSPAADKKSLAVATGELFLGLASLLLRSRTSTAPVVAPPGDPEVFPDRERAYFSGEGESIASVVRDPVDQEVLWEQRLKDVEAEKERKKVNSPGFSFSAAGLLFPYHLGVAQFLLEKGYIKREGELYGSCMVQDCDGYRVSFETAYWFATSSVRYGTSGVREGELYGSCMVQDCDGYRVSFETAYWFATSSVRYGTSGLAVLRDVLSKFLPDDVHIRSNGRVRVAITQLFWRPKGLLVDQFDSKEDLINAVFTSSFIPGYLAPRPATIFRNRLCIDGGLTLFMPPTSASETVHVCAFPANRLGLNGIGISPDCNPENRASPRQLFNWALEPAEDYILDKLYELGYLDAAVWAEQNPVESIVKEGSINSGQIMKDTGSANSSQMVKDAGNTNGSHIVEDEDSSNSM